MLGGLNKDDKEADEENGFVRPFANEYEDYSGDGIEDDESEDRSIEGYADEDNYQKARRRGGIGKKEDRPFKDYDDEDYQSGVYGEDASTIRGDTAMHGDGKGINKRRGKDGNRIKKQHYAADNDIVFEETQQEDEHQGWSRESHNVGFEDYKLPYWGRFEDSEDGGRAKKNPSEDTVGQWKTVRRAKKEEHESEDTSEEASGWSSKDTSKEASKDTSKEAAGWSSAKLFGGTVLLLLLIITFLLYKWR